MKSKEIQNNKFKDFERALKSIKSDVDELLKGRDELVLGGTSIKKAVPFPHYHLPESLINILQNFEESVNHDIYKYSNQPQNDTENLNASKDTVTTGQSGVSNQGDDGKPVNNIDAVIAASVENSIAIGGSDTGNNEADGDSSVSTSSSPQLNIPSDSYFSYFKESMSKDILSEEEKAYSNQFDLETLNDREYNILFVAIKEYLFLSENIDELRVPEHSVGKLEGVVTLVAGKRYGDAITALKSMHSDDPNNRCASFLLGQILYFQSHNGMLKYLPEARMESKSSCIFSDDVFSEKLTYYRYQSVISEFPFSQEHALDLMRNYYLLSPEPIIGKNGLFAGDGAHLKCWILLAKMHFSSWERYEFESVVELASKAIGGTVVYIHFLSAIVRQKISDSKVEEVKDLVKLEDNIFRAFQYHEALINNINSHFSNGLMENEPAMPWTIQNRYLHIFLSVLPAPTFIEIFLNSSLDVRRFNNGDYPDDILNDKGLISFSFWRTWAVSITPFSELRISNLIPFEDVFEEAYLLIRFEEALEILVEIENEITGHDRWEEVSQYMPNYMYKSFVEVGSGSPHALRAPRNLFYLPYYSSWSKQDAENILPSEVLRARAKLGGFVTIKELNFAFQGVGIIVNDVVHGLGARNDAVLRLLDIENGGSEEDTSDSALKEHINNFWWLYVVIIPLAIFTFIIMSGSQDYMGAIQTFAMIAGVFMAGILIIYSLSGRGDD